MTINEKHDWGTPTKSGDVTTGRKGGPADKSTTHGGAHALVDLLNAGEPYAVAFGGQGGNWLENLEELISSAGIESELSEVIGEAALLLQPVARELVVVRPIGFEPMQWVRALAADEPLPTSKQLTTAAISGPGILLAQLAAIRASMRQGLDLYGTPPVSMAGHSQGVIACESLRAKGTRDAELLAMIQLIGAAGSLVSRRRGMVGRGDKSPMVSVTNVDPARIAELLEDFSTDVRTVLPPVLSIRNGRRSVVITGTPEQLSRFELYCSKITEKEEAERKAKLRGGAVFSPEFHGIQVEVGFHTPRLADAIDVVDGWGAKLGIDSELLHHFAKAIYTEPFDWVDEIERLHDSGARWIIDLGPSDTITRVTAPVIRGLGVGIVPAATRAGQRNLFTVGAAPEVAPAWSSYAPSVISLPDGSIKLSTKFTRLTGRSPMLLAGMTPTTVDAKIVAAAANAGHWAELAGGGQVTEPIFDRRIAELTQLLEPGRAVQFNTLFLDPYLWKLQVGGKRLVQKARQSGAPIDGVIVSAGIPELDDAVAIIEELNEVGIAYVCFKPGTVEQIKSVIKIAAEVPDREVIVHVEGGRAGGHHSWEDLDDLLISTYGDLRKLSNITLCVGGGIGTPERAAQYLSGQWSQAYGFPIMPVDGILVGTATMAALEATTSPAVKQLLVDTTGTERWVGAGKAQGGMASGRSQLGADIHEIDNAASRCGRLLDDVAGDVDAVAERRDEIIAAMADTAKPYFGDVADMTYLQWLRRYVELAIGDGSSTADTKRDDSPWLDTSWRDRFEEMLKRAEARLHPQDSGPIETLFSIDAEGSEGVTLLENPERALTALLSRYPDAEDVMLHPADVPFFTTLCKTLGKPVNFVPVIDKDVRRWWRSDSLWQAHDARYTADQVCIIPGTEAVVGITRVDEPVGDLLDRFEQASIDEVLASGAEPSSVVSRRQARADVTGPLAVVLDSPDVLWAGRAAINPVHRIGAPNEWQVHENRVSEGRSEATRESVTATHPSTGSRLELSGEHVVLSVPLSDIWITIRFTLPATTVDGGMPVVTTEDASDAMRAVLAIAAGVDGTDALPLVENDSTTVTVSWDPEEVADHTGVTATFGSPLAPGLTLVPDALVGRCWPAVFSVIGSAVTESGFPVIEGLLSLVHLDHAAHLLAPMPTAKCELTVTATASAAVDTEVGRVVPVSVTIRSGDPVEGTVLATLAERFAIRGRTGAIALTDPVQAGGAITDNATDTPRRRRRDATVTAPTDMSAFAVVSGDHNPIHTDRAAALLAGLKSPIVHGMWLSAAAQHVVTATDGQATPPARLVGWTSRFLGMVMPGDEIDFRVDRVGIDRGAEIIEVTAKARRAGSGSGTDLVMSATAQLAAPKTVYAFPGQGIQSKGMGMEVRARSKAARKVWDTADKFTRETLGFSVLHVVRDNPTGLIASGVHYHHPEGVLYLTQFTQVAMATVAAAQVAEMREQGAFVEGAIACGHSVGEYTALACVSGVYPLEALLEVVFHRGSKMHDIVPRDENGRSNYRLAAIRPSQIDLHDDDVTNWVAEIAERTGEFLQIVNYNLRGSQYAIAGTVHGLEVLEEEVEKRRELSGGKRSFILVPGIDVPFHSEVLRVGVADFRRSLERVMPRDADPALLVGKYVPNLVPRPFTLDRDFIQEIRDLVPAEPLDEILADYDTWLAEKPRELCRKIVIELLAWQFASPVRWIETQDLLFIEEAAGGLGVERFVEIGVKSAPTVAGLATNTLKLPEYSHNTTEVLNTERDAAVLFANDEDPAPDHDMEADIAPTPVAESDSAAAAPAPAAAPAAPSGAPGPDDISFGADDATLSLIALSAKMRLDQVEALDSIESITDGASSRRNQLLVDLGSELNLGAIDGAAEADLAGLTAQVTKLARTYKPYGPVLSDAVNDQLRTVLGPSGKRPAAIAERVKKTWELGDGWVKHVTMELALGTREGTSVRGGTLGHLHDGALPDAATVDKVVDAAVSAVAARRGIAVSLPSAAGGGGGVVDSAALGEFAEQVTGRNGVLATAARAILGQLGLDAPVNVAETVNDADLIDLVTTELGSEWPRLVAPTFDGRKAVLFDDRWASAREDLARLWLADEDEIDADWQRLSERFEAAGHTVATQASWWQGKALAAGRNVHASLYGRAAAGAQNPANGRYADEIAVVTGASKGSIAASVIAQLLDGGASVIATTSKLDDKRLAFYKELYRENARFGATLWVLPANMASYGDIDALVTWIGAEQTESLGPKSIHLKDALTPTLLFPFAAPRVAGDLSDAGSRSEMEMKVLLWAVQRLIGGLSRIGSERDIASRLHVVLPGSPNRGMFGGDGAYGEAKSALDALVTRWKAETSWSQRVSLAHALIGWTKGTGLMGHNDAIVGAVEEAGVTTYSTEQMASMLLALCDVESKVAAARAPITADLTGGLGEIDVDMAELAAKARADMSAESSAPAGAEDDDARTIKALPSPPRGYSAAPPPAWDDLDVDPADLIVIVGGAELGPYGSSRTRFEAEVDGELSAAGVLELAWTTGLVKWEDDPKPGWYDTASGDLVDEGELVERYHDTVMERVGIREFVEDGEAMPADHSAPLLVSVFLEKDFSFVVSSESDARAFAHFDPEHTAIAPIPDSGDWQVTRMAGTEIRVPRKMKLSRTVGAQIPTGFDPAVYGVSPDMMNSIDRLALWNLVTTVDAFLSSGFTPAELMRWVHPSLVASTQGTGMGGMTSMQAMFHGNLLGKNKPNDILQEVLPNVMAGHVVQSYVGSYGAMIHPVGACATTAVSVEEGVDKIRLGKAEFVVAGGYDDTTLEAIIGFGDMSATADTETMRAKGISDSKFSRGNDRRRLGFVEGQGGGTILLARGDLALEMGLPVLSVVGYVSTFGDGVHTSIPAPGLGALGAGRGGRQSQLATSLAKLGVGPDDIAVISKHDTSTLANDPNETELHERLASAMGRSAGAPMFIVSQKSLTGHSKGGAAAFQMMGMCQMLRDGVIPPNRSLDCVDDEMANASHFVWVREPLHMGGKFPLKAGLITSLGFGHVSGLIALVHPQAFLAALTPEQREDYQERAGARVLQGQRTLASAIAGGPALYEKPADRRFHHDAPEKRQEADMLLDPTSRLGADGWYGQR